MLNFNKLTLIFFLFLVGINMFKIFGCSDPESFFCSQTIWFYGTAAAVYLSISFILAFIPCSGFHHQVICRGRTEEPMVSLTFDDGPHEINTPAILGVLKKYQVTAAFFVTGCHAEQYPLLVKAIDQDGHLIGNHTLSHSYWFDFFSARRMEREIRITNDLIKQITGRIPRLFRPPYGVLNPMLSKALSRLNLVVVCWNIRSFDTLSNNNQNTINKIVKNIKPGSIIVLHDHTEFVRTSLESLILAILKAGFRFEPLNELADVSPYQ